MVEEQIELNYMLNERYADIFLGGSSCTYITLGNATGNLSIKFQHIFTPLMMFQFGEGKGIQIPCVPEI